MPISESDNKAASGYLIFLAFIIIGISFGIIIGILLDDISKGIFIGPLGGIALGIVSMISLAREKKPLSEKTVNMFLVGAIILLIIAIGLMSANFNLQWSINLP